MTPSLVMLGKQGSGKGTQCARLAKHLGVAHLSTGDLLRSTVRAGDDLGQKVQRYLDHGELVPDTLMVTMVEEAVEGVVAGGRGYLLDGFPRTVAQAEALLAHQGDVDAVVDLMVPTEIVLARLVSRRVCPECGSTTTVADQSTRFVRCERCPGVAVRRADDNPVAIERRLALYTEQSDPLVRWYAARGRLVTVDGVGAQDVVFGRILDALAPQLELQAS